MPRFPLPLKLIVLALLVAGIAWRLSQAEDSRPEAAEAAERHCETRTFEGSRFTACRYDSTRHRIAIADAKDGKPLRGFEALQGSLGAEAGDLLFAMNAGMYDEESLPIGLHVEDGNQIHAINLRDGPGNFHMKPNGVFAVDLGGRVSIVPSDAWGKRKARFASQSGPMLLIGGKLHPKIQADGPSLHIRNGVGTADGRTAWFVISEDPVSFGRFARFLRDGLGCRDALFFDGTVSSLWDPGAGRMDRGYPLGPMVAVFRRP
ncbi:MAG TPA: phosphodiester glycosidase family protein [Allosphingosinicella sp.]